MDRETFERRRKLGYTDDPACITEPVPRKWQISLGWQVTLLVAGVCVGVWGVLFAEVERRLWFLALGAVCLLVLIVVPLVLLYRNFKAPAEKVLIEVAVDVMKSKLSEHRKRR